MGVDLSVPLEGDALLVIDPYPLADSVNFPLSKGAVPLQSAERWLSRELNADVRLEQHHQHDRLVVWVNGQRQQDLVTVKVHARASRKRKPASVAREAHREPTHPDVEYAVDDYQGDERIFKT